MYKINDNTYAIEEGDNISFVRDDGGNIDILAGAYQDMKDGDPEPRLIDKDECVVLTIMTEVPF